MINKWQERWTKSPKGRTTYKYLPNIREKLDMHWLKPNKWMAQVLDKEPSTRSEKNANFGTTINVDCGMIDDNEHAIIRCKKYHEVRRVYTQIFRYGNISIKK